jgi:hypothetical protein
VLVHVLLTTLAHFPRAHLSLGLFYIIWRWNFHGFLFKACLLSLGESSLTTYSIFGIFGVGVCACNYLDSFF